MIKKFLCLLCTLFVFVSCPTKADEMHKQEVVKINGIAMFESAANKVFIDAKNKHIDIFDAKNKNIKVEKIVRNTDVIINESQLMDKVTELYLKAISSNDGHDIVCERSEGKKIVVYVDKDEKLIRSIILNER
jgi:hypothetical protein